MKSEFALLSDLAIAQGVTHSELIAKIHIAIIEALRQQYPKSPIDAVVVVDEVSGEVHIYSEGKDITPPKFKEPANQIARQTLINLLHRLSSQHQPTADKTDTAQKKLPSFQIPSIFTGLFFWGYNLYFILFNLFQAAQLASDIRTNGLMAYIREIGWAGLFSNLILLAIPCVAIVLAVTRRRAKNNLLHIFFLFELPLAFICLVPLSMIRQTTPFMGLLMVAVFCIPVMLYLYFNTPTLSARMQKISLFIHQFVLTLAVYLLFLFSFTIPLLVSFITSGASYNLLAGTMLLTLSLIPFLVVMFVYRMYQRVFKELSLRLSVSRLYQLQVIFALIIFAVAGICAYQPSPNRLFSILSKYTPQADFATRESIASQLVGSKDQLKQALLDEQDYNNRYYAAKDTQDLKNYYMHLLGTPEPLARGIQQIFTMAAYPFIYQADIENIGTLATNYQDIFGEPYWQPASITPTENKNVLLSSRTITSNSDDTGHLSTITVDEQYENQTVSQQEVIYEFSLPAGSVVTDLRLGPDLEFPGIVAPRGAAQRTYESQLQIRRDPALLEQIGPDQYRLRVFPVPGNTDMSTLKGRLQRVSYTYVTPAAKDGYSLPQFLKKTNIFTDARSQLTFKESESVISFDKKIDVCQATVERLSMVTTTMSATLIPSASDPLLQRLACGKDSELLKTLVDSGTKGKLAVAYDISANAQNADLYQQLRSFLSSTPEVLDSWEIDMIPFNSQLGPTTPLTASSLKTDSITHFGRTQDVSILSSIPQPSQYSAIFVLAAKNANYTQYPFAKSPTAYFIYPDRVPAYSQTFLTRMLQSNGYATTSVVDAFRRYRLSTALPGLLPVSQYFQGQIIMPTTTPVTPLVPFAPITGKSAIFNRMLLSQLIMSPLNISTNLQLQDQLNTLATTSNIVTPNSSLIALVNQTQKDILQQQSSQYNRYQDQPMTTSTQNLMPVPMPNNIGSPAFGRVGNPFAVDVMEMNIPSTDSPMKGQSLGAPAVVTASNMSPFIVFTGFIMVVGLVFYLLKHLLRR